MPTKVPPAKRCFETVEILKCLCEGIPRLQGSGVRHLGRQVCPSDSQLPLRSRRTDPARVDRHWLVLAVATLWVLAYGTRVEEVRLRGLAPGACADHP